MKLDFIFQHIRVWIQQRLQNETSNSSAYANYLIQTEYQNLQKISLHINCKIVSVLNSGITMECNQAKMGQVTNKDGPNVLNFFSSKLIPGKYLKENQLGELLKLCLSKF